MQNVIQFLIKEQAVLTNILKQIDSRIHNTQATLAVLKSVQSPISQQAVEMQIVSLTYSLEKLQNTHQMNTQLRDKVRHDLAKLTGMSNQSNPEKARNSIQTMKQLIQHLLAKQTDLQMQLEEYAITIARVQTQLNCLNSLKLNISSMAVKDRVTTLATTLRNLQDDAKKRKTSYDLLTADIRAIQLTNI